jgi:hypothetical protein
MKASRIGVGAAVLGLSLSAFVVAPAHAGVACSKGGVCPYVKNDGSWGRIAMFDHIDNKGNPYGTTRYLFPGQTNRTESAARGTNKMKDPDYLMGVGEGSSCGLLKRRTIGRDKAYPNGVKITDVSRGKWYVVRTTINCDR